MSGTVTLKGNKYGLTVNISEAASFETIKSEIADCFISASGMFRNEKIAIAFEGKKLTDDEKGELIDIIKANCSLNIVAWMDFDPETEERFKKAVKNADKNTAAEMKKKTSEDAVPTDPKDIPELSPDFDLSKIARFYKGNVRSGMVINEESSLVVIGDINPGGEIYSAGNILIFGSLKGKAFAGINGNSNAFVFALNMEPIQIQIADKIGRASDKKSKKNLTDEHEPKIAMIKDNSIAIELVSKSVLNDITL